MREIVVEKGGFSYTHVTPPVSRKKKEKKKERKILTVEILTWSSEIRAIIEENSKLIVFFHGDYLGIISHISPPKHIL